MKRWYIILSGLFLLCLTAETKGQTFRLTGKVSLPGCDTVVIYHYPFFIPNAAQAYTRTVLPLTEGHFSYRADPHEMAGRYSSLLVHLLIRGKETGMLKDRRLFLAHRDDEVDMQVSPSEISFSGRGAAKYNTIMATDTVSASFPLKGTLNAIVGGPDGKKNLDLLEAFQDSLYRQKLAVIAVNAPKMSAEVREILELDAFAHRQLTFLRTLQINLSVLGKKDSVVVRNYIQKFREYYHDFQPDSNRSKVKAYAPRYAEYLVEVVRCRRALERGGYQVLHFGQEEAEYEYLKHSLTGLLRDKVLASYIFRTLPRLEQSRVPEGGCDDIQDDYIKSLVCNQVAAGKKGEQMIAFSLTDTAGASVSWNDLQGKITLIDFWYTGCGACARLSGQLSDFMLELKNRTDFRLITISVDRDIAKWKQSVWDGKYTHGAAANLYTNGYGPDHSLVRHFNILSFPRLILIDKDGTMINSNVRPDPESVIAQVKKALRLSEN